MSAPLSFYLQYSLVLVFISVIRPALTLRCPYYHCCKLHARPLTSGTVLLFTVDQLRLPANQYSGKKVSKGQLKSKVPRLLERAPDTNLKMVEIEMQL